MNTTELNDTFNVLLDLFSEYLEAQKPQDEAVIRSKIEAIINKEN